MYQPWLLVIAFQDVFANYYSQTNQDSLQLSQSILTNCSFQFISFNFVHPNQLGGLKQQSTTDTGLYLTYLICIGWVKGLYTSTLVFDIAQFFSLLNHILLPMILNKVGFDLRISSFFSNYLINRKTQYI